MDQPVTESSILTVRDLGVRFDTPAGPLHAVRGVSFHLGRGETLGIVREPPVQQTAPGHCGAVLVI